VFPRNFFPEPSVRIPHFNRPYQMVISGVSFPLKLSLFKDQNLADFFPARHGRVTFTKESAPTWSPAFRRFLSSIHYEFCEFHRRINEPIETARVSSESILVDYAIGVVNRVEKAKSVCPDEAEEEFTQLARAGMLLELIQICQVDSSGLGACKFPRWLIRQGGINLESLVLEMEQFLERVQDDDGLVGDKLMEKKFWDNMRKLALMDVSPVIASLIEKYLNSVNFRKNKYLVVGEYSASLLLAFYNEVPSLYDLAMTSSTGGAAPVDQLEKRRAYASVALHKDVTGSEVSQFFWKLHIGDESDYGLIRSAILDLKLPRLAVDVSPDLSWYEKLGLVWCWLHVLDEPGEALSLIAKDVAAGSDLHSTNVSVFDACMFAVFTNDLLVLFTLIIQEESAFAGSWFSAIVSDLVFYTGADGGEVLGYLRDRLLMHYCRDLMTISGLGTRMACDIVVTMGERSASRGSEELIGRLAAVDSTAAIGRTKQWLLAVKLSHDHNVGMNLTESLCLEKFQSDSRNSRVVDAIQSLAVAAEVGKDVHVGACRISDYLDQENVREKFHDASLASLGSLPSTGLLPEYIDSGRFRFFAGLETSFEGDEGKMKHLISLVTSPDCPPESVVELVTEIRHMMTQARKANKDIHLSLEEGIALSKALIDVSTSSGTANAPEEVLMSWIADEMMNSALTTSE